MSSSASTPPSPDPSPDPSSDATPGLCPRCHQPIPPGAAHGLCPACLLAAGFFTQPGPDTRDGSDSPPPTPAELAPEFPALEIIELLGRGGMGAVYKARQRHLERLVALKLLRPGLDSDPSFAERFTREARALAQLNHPGIVTLHEFGHTPGGRYFIVMEFVDGVNLRQLLAAGRLSPREALAIVPPLCDALQYAHDHGLVHRDIKPENILVDRLGRVKIADFGLAKLASAESDAGIPAGAPSPESPPSAPSADNPSPAPSRTPHAPSAASAPRAHLTEAGRVMGTPRYMSPEQRDHPAAVDHRADIYALGVVLYQMLTGELPDEKQLQPPSRRVLIDVRLDEIVLRALEKDPALRYAAASEFKTRVEDFTVSSATTHVASSPTPTIDSTFATTPPLPPGATAAPSGHEALPLWPASMFIFFLTLFCGSLRYAAEEFPARVAVHFDLAGRPDAWAERGVALLVVLVAGVGVSLALVLLFGLLRFFPAYLFNLPHRDFWLSPERAASTHARLLRQGLWFGSLFLLFLQGLQILTIIAHQQRDPVRLPMPGLWIWSGLFLATVAVAIFRLRRQFLRPEHAAPLVSEKPLQSSSAPARFFRHAAPWLLIFLASSALVQPIGTAIAILESHQAASAVSADPSRAWDLDVVVTEAREKSPRSDAPRPPVAAALTVNVHVFGAVHRPGVYPLRGDASLLDALAAAGGWTRTADWSAVTIATGGNSLGSPHDLGAILSGEAVNPHVPTDSTIFVPERNR